ncbi:TetR/AcrR family transcriptional regulator [Demequina phytophila]|uniref:TetR/AcrR family transcriptional regulator n=1 Tax=Demequina phytophila TaxID=1638981 RepID=UPI00078123FD|nr:TetR/AcrR family transcriptional regulator [Demequina phytophila]
MTDPAPARRPRAERGDYRVNHLRLLEAAFAVFDDAGIDAPLSAVAQVAEVGEATLYRHFANRDDLVVELYDVAAGRVEDAVRETLESEHRDVAARLDAFFATMVGAIAAHRSYPQLAIRGSRLRPGRGVDPRTLVLLRELVAEAQESGLLERDVLASDLTTLALTTGTLAADATPATDFVWRRHLALGRRGLVPGDGIGRNRELESIEVPAHRFGTRDSSLP